MYKTITTSDAVPALCGTASFIGKPVPGKDNGSIFINQNPYFAPNLSRRNFLALEILVRHATPEIPNFCATSVSENPSIK